MKIPPLPAELYYVTEGRVAFCKEPAATCEHKHYFFLASAAQRVAETFFKHYHISSDGEVERCKRYDSCERSPHFLRRWEAVAHHRETYEFSGPWRARENPYVSLLEKEVGDFVSLLGYPVMRNSRNIIGPYELDLYIPARRVAIEFNGDFWHSEEELRSRKGVGARQYHLNKYTLCERQAIVLGFVWEQNWLHDWLTVVDALSDLIQFRRHSNVLEQFEKAMVPSDFYWESLDRRGALQHREKIEQRLRKAWNVS